MNIAGYTRITVDPNMMGGVPCIRNLRMPVATVIGNLASGMTHEEILKAFPYLEEEDIIEALSFAYNLIIETTLPPLEDSDEWLTIEDSND